MRRSKFSQYEIYKITLQNHLRKCLIFNEKINVLYKT